MQLQQSEQGLVAREPLVAAVENGEGLQVSMQHTWPWPPWVTVILLILLTAFAAWLYFDRRGGMSHRLCWILAGLRLGLLVLILFMMYGWVIDRHRTDLSDLVVVLDDSQSMQLADHPTEEKRQRAMTRIVRRAGLDEPTRWNQSLALLVDPKEGWLRVLRQRYRLKLYLLGESLRPLTPDGDAWESQVRELQPNEPASRLGDGLQQILESQRGRPTAAIVLLTDGITTAGRTIADVAALARQRAIPLYTVGLGDDERPRDVRLADLLVDDAVFVDDVVNFDAKVQHHGFADRTVAIRLYNDKEQVVAEQSIRLAEFGGSQPVRLSYRAPEQGHQEFVVRVDALPGEADVENNQLEASLVVRDVEIRVLLVQAQPSYEFRTLKSLLGRSIRRQTGSKVVDLTTVLQDADFEIVGQDRTAARAVPVSRERLFQFDVLMIGDANPALFSQSVMQNMVEFVTERGGGVVFISGPRFTPLAFRGTPLEKLVPIDLSAATVPDRSARLSEPFSMVPTSLGLQSSYLQLGASRNATAQVWRGLPGAHWFLSGPEIPPGARVLVERPPPLNSPDGSLPVITMQFVGAGKVVFHATDETYRWSRHRGSDQYYARYWMQLVRYLSRSKLLSDREPAEVSTDRSRYRPGEVVRIQVRFRDDRLAPSDDEGVLVVLESANGRRRAVTLHRDSFERGQFAAFVDDLDAGQYRVWLASPNLPRRPAAGQFVIEPPASEQARSEMESDELQEAARTSRGRFYRAGEADRLMIDLPRGREVRVETLPSMPLWNSHWLAALFVLLITAEWTLRRRAGLV